MILTITIILVILILTKVIDFSWSGLAFILCVALCIAYLPEILSFLFNAIVNVMTAIMEFAF